MPVFKNHRGQYHTANAALVAFTAMYVILAATSVSVSYHMYSASVLIGVLAVVAASPVILAIYAISKNNKISELKAPAIVVDGSDPTKLQLQVTKEVYEEMKENNKHKSEDGSVVPNKYCINFTNPEGKSYRVIINTPTSKLGSTLLFEVSELEGKNDEGKFMAVKKDQQAKELGLDKSDNKEFNTYLSSVVVEEANKGKEK